MAEDCVKDSRDTAGLAIFELLLQHGAVAYPRKGQIGWQDGQPMAHVFILRRRSDMLDVLLRHHPGFVFSRNAAGLTPLHIAAWARDLVAVQLLIDHGADVNARSTDGTTPFLTAFCYRPDLSREDGVVGTVECQLVDESLEIGHVLGAFGADTTARRSWQFAPPNRFFLEYDPEDAFRSCPLTFADDTFINNWKMWVIRRNLDNDIGTCGSALFLRPSIISSKSSMELCIPVFGPNQTLPPQGLYCLSVRLGVLDCEHNDMSLLFMLTSQDEDKQKGGEGSKSKPIGYLKTGSFPRNHACEVKFEVPILIEKRIYVIFVFMSSSSLTHDDAVAGLFLDWIELSPIPAEHALLMPESSKAVPPNLILEKTIDITDKVPRGIRKIMAEEAIDGKDDSQPGGAWRTPAPLGWNDVGYISNIN